MQDCIPIFWAGMSPYALIYGGTPADVFAIGPGSLAQVAENCAMIRAEAVKHGRTPRISMSMRLVPADSESAAWERARQMLAAVKTKQEWQGLLGRDLGKAAEAVTLKAAEADNAQREPHLWPSLTQITQGRLQMMCLVGTADQLADALAFYHQAGIDNFFLTGFDWEDDTRRIGAQIAPRLRQLCERSYEL